MGSGSFKVGRAFGIDLKVHWTFFLLFFAGYGYAHFGNAFGALLS